MTENTYNPYEIMMDMYDPFHTPRRTERRGAGACHSQEPHRGYDCAQA